MEEIGIVKGTEGVTAKVMMARRNSCCESCEKDACNIPEDGVMTEAVNTAGAKVGQKVKIIMKPYTYIKGAILIYIFPIAALIGGAVLGKVYFPSYINIKDSDIVAAIGGFGAFFVSLILVQMIARSMDKKTEYKSVIESIVEG